MRKLFALCCALCGPSWLALPPSGATAVTFDFEYFPDSAGCSEPTAVSDGPYENCDPDWVADWEAGVHTEHVHTVGGLTLTLTAEFVDWGWIGPVINCGNTPDCTPYVADFSAVLLAVQVDLLGAQNTCGCGEEFPDPLTFYLRAYSGPSATGALLGEVVVDASLGPATLALDAPPGSPIASIAFGAATADNGECGGDCVNLGIADNLIATPVPEPATAALVALGLSALVRSRFHSRPRSQQRIRRSRSRHTLE